MCTKAIGEAMNNQNSIQTNVKPLVQGNIDIYHRPIVKNSDGSISTVRSMNFEEDGQEILIPTVSDEGEIMDPEQPINYYHKTGKFLGKFKTEKDAEDYAEALHEQQSQYYDKQRR